MRSSLPLLFVSSLVIGSAVGLAPVPCLPSAARAQFCPGDCGGDGAVSIGDLIIAINISIGRADLEDCAAVDTGGDGLVSISELITAVRNGLNGCPATPTPSSTAPPTSTLPPSPTPTRTSSPSPTQTRTTTHTPTTTSTPTSTPTVTPTASSTPTLVYPDVSGRWNEGQLGLASSTCLEVFATAFADELARRPPCPHQVSSAGPIGTVVDCTQRAFVGEVDLGGVLSWGRPDEVAEQNGCTITLGSTVRVPAAASPTTATYFFDIRFGGTCPLASCELTATAAWSRVSPF